MHDFGKTESGASFSDHEHPHTAGDVREDVPTFIHQTADISVHGSRFTPLSSPDPVTAVSFNARQSRTLLSPAHRSGIPGAIERGKGVSGSYPGHIPACGALSAGRGLRWLLSWKDCELITREGSRYTFPGSGKASELPGPLAATHLGGIARRHVHHESGMIQVIMDV